VKPLKTKTGTIPPLTPVAQSAVRDDIAAREAVKAAREAEVSELAGKVDDAERGSAR
jgi:PiT family inorganic phosphate transporter